MLNNDLETVPKNNKFSKKLNLWVEQALINENQARAIYLFEESGRDIKRKSMFGRSMIGIGALAVMLGLLAIIGANWMFIPGSVKLSTHLALNIGLCFGILWSDRRGYEWIREGATVLFFGLTLTFMILVGQVYQIEGDATKTLVLWLGLATPAVFLFGRTSMNAVPWCIAFISLLLSISSDLYLWIGHPYWAFIISIVTLYYIPLGIAALSALPDVQRDGPVWTKTITGIVLCCSFVFASIASLSWYLNMNTEMMHTFTGSGGYFGYASRSSDGDLQLTPTIAFEWGLLTLMALIPVAFGSAVIRSKKFSLSDQGVGIAKMMQLSSVIAFLPFILMAPEMDVMSPIYFIGYWLGIAIIANRYSMIRIFNLSIYLIAIRLIIVYVELFGSLLSTGVGLILSGLFLIGFVYLFRRIKTYLTFQGGRS